MEPRIQYATTKDGVSIAFSMLGEGKPLVYMPWIPLAHQQLEWRVLDARRLYERLAEKRRLIRYDNRGSGLSDREVSDLSVEAQLLDLQAVVERLNLQQFALWARGESGPAAITYAASHPQHVSHLILWCAWARASDVWTSARWQAFTALRRTGDWGLLTETLANVVADWPTREQARRQAAFLRDSVTPEMASAFWEATAEFDVTALLSQVESPALVLHPTKASWMRVDVAKSLASRIPNARLALLDSGANPVGDEVEAVASVVDEFLSEGEEAPATPELPEGMAVILFADIAESTALTERIGDAAFREKARELDTALRGVIGDNGGTPIEGKLLGDGVLAVFTSARQAIEAALGCGRSGDEAGLALHLGIHAGDVIREGSNVYGGAVNLAARIADVSAPGEVLVSDTARGLARTSAGVAFEDRGEHSLKGVAEPQRLFAVRPRQ